MNIEDADNMGPRYWVYHPGEQGGKWEECLDRGLMLLGWPELGDFSRYVSKSDIEEALRQAYGKPNMYNTRKAIWDMAHVIKPGDVVFACRGRSTILGRGIVQDGYHYDEHDPDGYCNRRPVKWTELDPELVSDEQWSEVRDSLYINKTLTDISYDHERVNMLNGLFDIEPMDDDDAPVYDCPEYGRDEFLNDVYMSDTDYERVTALLKRKKNLILQGAPGVGKTYAAKRLAYALLGSKDPARVQMVQFHQSYSYEDFIMGYRPSRDGFELRHGVFYRFCKQAEADDERDYCFIIDEINRGNLSRIFGETFMLIEKDKRGMSLQLPYADESFSVPANVYIIGLMNTADRSLAMIDYALRRRFAFFTMEPGFDTDGFRQYQEELDSPAFDRLVDTVKELNDAIARDGSLGPGFRIGHSFLCGLTKDDMGLDLIVEYELVPLLEEYWFDDRGEVDRWAERLRKAVR